MVFVIDHDTMNKTWSQHGESYLFDFESFWLVEKDSDEAFYLKNYIKYPCISDVEVQKEYVGTLNNKQIDKLFAGRLSDREFISMFWRAFFDGDEKETAYRIFESRYRLRCIESWCNENNIPYYVDRNDKQLKFILGE